MCLTASIHSGPGPAAINPLPSLLAALAGVLAPGGVVALVSDKGQKVPREGWQRCDHFQVGLRKVEILRAD